jgi:sulfur carrier protein ThiS
VASVRIQFHGTIDRRGFAQGHEVEIASNTTVQQVLSKLGYPPPHIRVIVAQVNGQRRANEAAVVDGELLEIFVPTGGG